MGTEGPGQIAANIFLFESPSESIFRLIGATCVHTSALHYGASSVYVAVCHLIQAESKGGREGGREGGCNIPLYPTYRLAREFNAEAEGPYKRQLLNLFGQSVGRWM